MWARLDFNAITAEPYRVPSPHWLFALSLAAGRG